MTKSEVKSLGHWPSEFLEGLISEVPPISVSGLTKLVWNCSIHGNYSQSISLHLKGCGCPSCAKIAAHKSRRDKNPLPQWFLNDLLGSKDYDGVVNNTISLGSKLQFICPIHGPYCQQGYHHLNHHCGCPKCKGELISKASQSSKRTDNPYPQWFLDELFSDDKLKVLSGEYGVNDKVRFVCPIHGVYSQAIYSHISMSDGTKKCGCPSCAAEISKYGSSLELKLRSFLESKGIRVTKERGLIKSSVTGFPMELDLYLPDYHIAIEVDGLYYHSIEVMQGNKFYSTKVDMENYHLMKTELCSLKGIQLFHLFEDDLMYKFDICINLILSKCNLLNRTKVYARCTTLKVVSNEDARLFYDSYHIQGYGQGFHYGLYYEDHLCSCMSVRRCMSNTTEANAFELNRYASIPTIFVVGGFDKLLKHFIIDFSIKRLISFADRTISDGSLYYHEGFTLESISKPDYKYVYKGKRYHKFNFRKSSFLKKGLKYDSSLTEEGLAKLNGLTRIYDCGKMKFVKEYE